MMRQTITLDSYQEERHINKYIIYPGLKALKAIAYVTEDKY